MKVHHRRFALTLGLIIAIGACAAPSTSSIPSEPISSATSAVASDALHTATPRPENTSTVVPISSATQIFTPESVRVSGWFLVPELTNPDAMEVSTAGSFQGLKIPPLPDELVIEFHANQPYGEVPANTIFYQLFLIRKGNTRMLWLGIPFKEILTGQETPYRIYDSIPFPATETNSVLIAFVCTRRLVPDIFLIVVAETPELGASATHIQHAWRIDQASTSLQAVSTQAIECSPNW